MSRIGMGSRLNLKTRVFLLAAVALAVAIAVVYFWPERGGPTADEIADHLSAEKGCTPERVPRNVAVVPPDLRSAGRSAQEILGITCRDEGLSPYSILVRFGSTAAMEDALESFDGDLRERKRLCVLGSEFALLDVGNPRASEETCRDLKRG